MAAPQITPTPTSPVRGEPRPVFTAKANAILSSLSLFEQEINAISNWINAMVLEVESDRDEALGSKGTAVSAKDTAVSAKNTAVTAKNDAVSAKNTAATARDTAVAAKDVAVAISQGGNVLAIDALRQTGDSVSVHKGDGSSQSVSVVATNSARALHADALRVSGTDVQLVKANGASEVVAVGDLLANLGVYNKGSIVTAYYLDNNVFTVGAVTSGVNLLFASGGTFSSRGLTGSWRSHGSADSINGAVTMRGAHIWRKI